MKTKEIDRISFKGDNGDSITVTLWMDTSYKITKYHKDNRGMVIGMDTEPHTYFYYQVYYGKWDNRKLQNFLNEKSLVKFVSKLTTHDQLPFRKFLHPHL